MFQKPDSKEVATEYEEKCNRKVGVMDGKHVPVNSPSENSSTYLNYKNFFSITSLAMVDADNNFW